MKRQRHWSEQGIAPRRGRERRRYRDDRRNGVVSRGNAGTIGLKPARDSQPVVNSVEKCDGGRNRPGGTVCAKALVGEKVRV